MTAFVLKALCLFFGYIGLHIWGCFILPQILKDRRERKKKARDDESSFYINLKDTQYEV